MTSLLFPPPSFQRSWENGENHLIFNFLPGTRPDYSTVLDVNTDRAIIVGAGFDSWTYRTEFDVSVPVYSAALEEYRWPEQPVDRTVLLVAAQLNLFPRQFRILQELTYDYPNELLLLQRCPTTRVFFHFMPQIIIHVLHQF